MTRRSRVKNVPGLILLAVVLQIWMQAVAPPVLADDTGACCTCPPNPGEPGVCTPNLTEPECDALGGWWIMAGDCDPNPCPGEPDNNVCVNAMIVHVANFTQICSISGNDCPTGVCPAGEGDCVIGQMIDYSNRCATDDFADLSTNCATTGDLHYDVWYEVVNFTASRTGVAVSSCDLVDHDQMIAVYDADIADCASLGPSDEVACGNDDCGEVGGPAEIPDNDYPEVWCMEPGKRVLVRVGGWDNPEHTGDSRGAGRLLFTYIWCPLPLNPEPCLEPHDRLKNRFLSFEANNEVACAFQVELMGLQKCCVAGKTACVTNADCSPGDTCEDCVQCFGNSPYGDVGMTWWVSKPRCTDTSARAVAAPPCDEPNVWRAQLTVGPVCHGGTNNDQPCDADDECPGGLCGRGIWPEDCIHIADCEVIPQATYALRATWNPLADPPLFGEDLTMETIRKPGTKCWADLVGRWENPPGHWTAPDRVVSMDDLMAAVMYYKVHPNRPHRTWVEVNDRSPDMVLGFGDIQKIVDGFKSLPYPFENPSACPPEVRPPPLSAQKGWGGSGIANSGRLWR